MFCGLSGGVRDSSQCGGTHELIHERVHICLKGSGRCYGEQGVTGENSRQRQQPDKVTEAGWVLENSYCLGERCKVVGTESYWPNYLCPPQFES